MAEKTAISWTDHTMNFWIGCTKVSPACTNCYAAVDTFARRERANGRELWGPKADRHRTSPGLWKKPYQWNKNASKFYECLDCGHRDTAETYCFECETTNLKLTRQRVFVSSLSDICEEHPQITDDMRSEVAKIVMDCKNLDWLFLTKRPESFNRLWLDLFGGSLPDNLWVGTTVENQEYADKRIPALISIPAKVRWLSCEPLLGPVGLSDYIRELHWIIVGGESGRNARPMHPKWASSLRDQCAQAGVPFHFKQWGEWSPRKLLAAAPGIEVVFATRDGSFTDEFTGTDITMFRLGKKNTGRQLLLSEHNEFPK